MTRFLFIYLCVIVTRYCSANLLCPEGETVDDCPVDCPYYSCPKNELEEKSPCSSSCLPPKCVCGFNQRRAENGTCIPTTECPAFDCSHRPNEKFDPCPRYCPTEDCSQASLNGKCSYLILLVRYCSPACRCIDGYWRNNGTCVPYYDCPGVW